MIFMHTISATASLTRALTPEEYRRFEDGWNQLIIKMNNPDLSGQHPPTGCLIPDDIFVEI